MPSLQEDINRANRRGVSVYSPTRALARPSGGVANAGTARRIGGGLPNGPVAPYGGGGGRIPQFNARPQRAAGGRTALQELYANRVPTQQSDQGGFLGTLVNNPIARGLQGALNVLDIPRRVVVSSLQEGVDAVNGGDADWGDWWDQVQDPEFGFGDVVGDVTNNRWINRLIGLSGDILLDPLTYVAGAGVISGTGRSSRLLGASRAFAAGVDEDVAKTIGRFGYSRLDDTTRAMLRDTAGDTIRDAGYYWKFPFVGDYSKIPGTAYLDRTVGTMFGTARAGISNIRPISRMAFWRSQEGLEAAFQKILNGRGDMPFSEAAELINLNRAERLAGKSYIGALSAQSSMLQRRHNNAQLTQMIADSEMTGGTAAHSFFEFAADQAQQGGVKFARGTRKNHIAHLYTERGQAWLSGADPDAVATRSVFGIPNTMDDVSASLLERKFTPRAEPYEINGKLVHIREGSIKEINKVFRDNFNIDFDMLETDFSTIAARYTKSMAESVGMVSAATAMVRSKSGKILRAGDNAATKEVLDEALMKYADDKVADQLRTEANELSGAAQKYRADSLEGVDDIRGLLGVHTREVLNELQHVSIKEKEALDQTVQELADMRADRYYTPEQQAATGATNKLEEQLNSTLRQLDTEIATTEDQIARIQRAALIENQAYREAIRQGRLERRINNVPERFKALREWNALMLRKQQQLSDEEVVKALRERARQAGLKADIIDRNLTNDSFLNLAAGDAVPRWLQPTTGHQRIVGPDGRAYDVPTTGQPEGARFTATAQGTIFRVTDREYWGPVVGEAEIRAQYSAQRAEILSGGEGDIEGRAIASQIASKELEVAEAQRRVNQVVTRQHPLVQEATSEVQVLRARERALKESIKERHGYPAFIEEHDALTQQLRAFQHPETGELGQAIQRRLAATQPIADAKAQVTWRERELAALQRKQENHARQQVATGHPTYPGAAPAAAPAVEARAGVQARADQLTTRRTRLEARLRQLRAAQHEAAPRPQLTAQEKATLTRPQQTQRLTELLRQQPKVVEDPNIAKLQAQLTDVVNQEQALRRQLETMPAEAPAARPPSVGVEGEPRNLPGEAVETPGGLHPRRVERLTAERERLLAQRARLEPRGRLADVAAREYQEVSELVRREEARIDELAGEAGWFDIGPRGEVTFRRPEFEQIVNLENRRFSLLMEAGERQGPKAGQFLGRQVEAVEVEIRNLLNRMGQVGRDIDSQRMRNAHAELVGRVQRVKATRRMRNAARRRWEDRVGNLPDIDDRLREIDRQLNAEQLPALPDNPSDLERTIARLNADEAREVAEARGNQPAGIVPEYTAVPALPARAGAPARRRLIDQPGIEGIGRLGMYGVDDRAVLEHAYAVTRAARRDGIATADNKVYQEALTQIREIESEVAEGIPLSHLAEADRTPSQLIDYNLAKIDEARTPMPNPKPARGVEGEPGYVPADPGYQAIMGDAGADMRGGDRSRIGRSKTAMEVAQGLRENVGKDLLDHDAFLPGDIADVDGLISKMDGLLNDYARYPMPQYLDQIDQVRGDLLRWSDIMNRYWAAMEDGLEPSEGLGALIVRQVLYKERRGIDNEVAELKTISQLDPAGIIEYNSRIDFYDRKVRAAQEIIDAAEDYRAKRGAYARTGKRSELEVKRAKARRRENARKLAALQDEGAPDAGVLSEYVQGLVRFWGDQVEGVDNAVMDYNLARHSTRDMNWPEVKRSQLEATIPRLEGEIEQYKASGRRLDRAIKVAQTRGEDVVRYSAWRQERALLTPEQAEAIIDKVPASFKPDLQRKIRQARSERERAVAEVIAPPLTIKIRVPGARGRYRIDPATGKAGGPQTMDLNLRQIERALHADALAARGVITAQEAAEFRALIPDDARELVTRKYNEARQLQATYADKVAAAEARGMIDWKLPTRGGVVELPLDEAIELRAKQAKSMISFDASLENNRIQLSVVNGTANVELDLVRQEIGDQLLVRNAAQEAPEPAQVQELTKTTKRLEREGRDIQRFAARQKRERTAAENERLEYINARLERLRGEPLGPEEHGALISRRDRITKAINDHDELLNGDKAYIEASTDTAERFLRNVTSGVDPRGEGVVYDEAGRAIVQDVERVAYDLTTRDVEIMQQFLTAEGGQVAATWVREINQFFAERGDMVLRSELNQLVQRMTDTFGDTELGRRISNSIIASIQEQAEAVDLGGRIIGMGVAAGEELTIRPELIRHELFNAMAAAAKSLKQQRQRDFGQMWDHMGFQFTTIPGLEDKLLAAGKILPGKYEIKGRRILTAEGDEVGRLVSRSTESKMGSMGYDMGKETWDRRAATKFILDNLRIQLNYTPESAINERLTSLGMRKQRINTMLRGLGAVTNFPKLKDPERFFTWLDNLDKKVTEEASDLGRNAREFAELTVPEELGTVDQHLGELHADLERALAEENQELADQIIERIDRLEQGQRPTTPLTEGEVISGEVEPPPPEAPVEAVSSQRRTLETERTQAQAELDRARERLTELEATQTATADSFESIIADVPPNKPPGEFSRAEIMEFRYNVLTAFERENIFGKETYAPGIEDRYDQLTNQLSDMNQHRWIEEAEESPETFERAERLAQKYADAEEEAGMMYAHEVDLADDLDQNRSAAQRDVAQAQEKLSNIEHSIANLGDDTEASMIDELSAAQRNEAEHPEHVEPQATDMVQPNEVADDIDDADLDLEQLTTEYEDVTGELNDIVNMFNAPESFGDEIAAQRAYDRMYELLARARKLEELRGNKAGTAAQRVLMRESPRYQRYITEAAARRVREVRYSWHDVVRGGVISSRTMPNYAMPTRAGTQQSKLGAAIMSMAGTPMGRGWTRTSLAQRERPWMEARNAIDATRERLGAASTEARTLEMGLLDEAAQVEADTARLAELEPQVAAAADVSDIEEAMVRAGDQQFARNRRLTVQRQQAAAAKMHADNEYRNALRQTDAMIAHFSDAVAAGASDFDRVMTRINRFERALNQMPPEDAKEWRPILEDIGRVQRELRRNPDIDPEEVKTIGRLLGAAFDAQQELLRLEAGAADAEALMKRRIKEWEKGAHLVGPIFARVLDDGWEPIAAKAMTGNDMKWVETLEDGTEVRHWNRDAIVVAQSLATAWNNVRVAATHPESYALIDKYTAFFKTYATAKPGFHVRNAISAVFMNLVDGVRFRDLSAAPGAWRAMTRDPADYLTNVAPNVVLNAKTGTTMADAFRVVWGSGAGGQFEEHGIGGALRPLDKGYSRIMNNVLTRWNRRTGSAVEGTARLAMAMDGLRKGMSVEAAMERVIKFHFDYTSMSRLDRQARRFIPFWTFMSRNLPLQIEQMFLRPRVYQMYRSVVRNFGQPLDPATPEYWLSQGVWTLDENASETEAPWYMAPDLPHLRVTEPFDAMAQGEWGKALFSDLNPLGLAPVEAFAINKKMYTGAPLEENYRDPTSAMQPLMPLFQMLGGTAEGGTSGQQLLDDRYAHVARSLLPPLDFIERLTDQSGTRAGRQDETLLRSLGAPVLQLTPELRESTQKRRYYAARDRLETQAQLAGS